MYVCQCRPHAVSTDICSAHIHVFTQVEALCWKLCHLENEDATYFSALVKKERKEIKVRKDKDRK
jgi:hypothetical protein